MNTMQAFNRTMAYIEETLTDGMDEKSIQLLSGYSLPLFSRVFSMLTNITLMEYIRLRRLTEAARALRETPEKVIDIAARCGYDSPDAFALAFKKFHGHTPTQVRKGAAFQVFAPIRMSLTITGGREMNISIRKKPGFMVAGIKREGIESRQCPDVWDDLFRAHGEDRLVSLGSGQSFGACYETTDCERINYMAGYDAKDAGEAEKLGLDIMAVPAAEYAVVQLKGPIPQCIHEGWRYIMEVFFPEQGYRHAGTPDFEVYDEGDMYAPDYEMELWVPVVKE